MMLPNLGRLSLRAAAPTGVFAPIPQPDDDDAPQEQDPVGYDYLPWNQWWQTFRVKTDNGVDMWFDGHTFAKWVHQCKNESRAPTNPLTNEPLSQDDVVLAAGGLPMDPGRSRVRRRPAHGGTDEDGASRLVAPTGDGSGGEKGWSGKEDGDGGGRGEEAEGTYGAGGAGAGDDEGDGGGGGGKGGDGGGEADGDGR